MKLNDMSHLASAYFEDLHRRSQEQERVPMTVRLHPDVKERIERMAKEVEQSSNTVAADLLDAASIQLARALADLVPEDKLQETFERLAYGKAGEGK